MAIKAPSVGHVFQHNILVHLLKFPRFSVHRHALMALRTGEYAWRERRGGHEEFLWDILLGRFGGGTEK
jgi:hypothetical protein